eukprot:COSAG03_NODE_377_length_8385_cov_12.259353_6_plen_268_part_00
MRNEARGGGSLKSSTTAGAGRTERAVGPWTWLSLIAGAAHEAMRGPTASSHARAGAGGAHRQALPLGSSDFPDEVLAIVCCFLSLSDLGRLACVSRRFTQPALAEPGGRCRARATLSAIEEGARLRLTCMAAEGPGAVRMPEETWLRALWREEYGLAFTACPGTTTSENGSVASRHSYGHQAVTCARQMFAGTHYAEFTVLSTSHSSSCLTVGVVGDGFDVAAQVAWCSDLGWMLWASSHADHCYLCLLRYIQRSTSNVVAISATLT